MVVPVTRLCHGNLHSSCMGHSGRSRGERGLYPTVGRTNVAIPLDRGDVPFDDNDRDKTAKGVSLGR